MKDSQWLADRFETDRAHLHAVALRLLGSTGEADDAVQEAWIRLNRSDTSDIENLTGWLTTVVARVSLDMLRSRRSRREVDSIDDDPPPLPSLDRTSDPEHEAILADNVGSALLIVLDTLAPAERLAFVLHDLFGMPFDEIGPIVDRSPVAARQLASRARRRVRGSDRTNELEPDNESQREIVEAFLAAAREGEFEKLLTLLDPDVVLRADQFAVDTARANAALGAPSLANVLRGSAAVARVFSGTARAARLALVDGSYGATWAPGGRPRAVFVFTVERDQILEMEIIYDPERVRQLDVELVKP